MLLYSLLAPLSFSPLPHSSDFVRTGESESFVYCTDAAHCTPDAGREAAEPRGIVLLGHCVSACEHGTWSYWHSECRCDDGWEGACCDTQEGLNGPMALRAIPNDGVEHHLEYVRHDDPGFPSGAQGIFWMDQRGTHTAGMALEPGYQQRCMSAADELLVTFGEASWDAASRCVKPVPVGGSTRKGHWTYMDQVGPSGRDNKSPFDFAHDSQLTLEFCFTSDDEIQIHNRLLVQGQQVYIPTWAVSLGMRKTAFGWDRFTEFGPDSFRKIPWSLRMLNPVLWPKLLFYLGARSLGSASGLDQSCHYPVFQIVDGHGRRTEHYDAYLRFANEQTTCSNSSFACPMNRGEGSQLVARRPCYPNC